MEIKKVPEDFKVVITLTKKEAENFCKMLNTDGKQETDELWDKLNDVLDVKY